jgi:hypothetical protein
MVRLQQAAKAASSKMPTSKRITPTTLPVHLLTLPSLSKIACKYWCLPVLATRFQFLGPLGNLGDFDLPN